MRKILSLLLAAALLLLALAGCSQTQKEEPLPESIEINFFYNDFYDMFNTQLEDVKDKYPYDLQAYNVFQASASDKMYTVLEGLGYPEELISSLTYPILTINGKDGVVTVKAEKKIVLDVREAFLTAGEDLFENGRGVYDPLEERTVAQQLEDYPLEKGSATAVYFYRLTCEECIQTEEEFMDTLPEQVEADGKSYPLQVVRINTRSGSNNEILQAFFEAYQVPEEDQMVPIVFTSQGYLAGYEDITQNLLPQLEAGAGLNFQYPG